MTLYWASVICFFVITNSEAQSPGSPDVPLVVPDPVVVRALDWLENQREPDFGFQENTPKAVIAFQLANFSSWYSPHNLLSLLTVKQMDTEILLQLFRRHESPLNPTDIAFHCIALNSLCRDPRQFYGHDLIGNINHQEMLLDEEFAVTSLAVCTSGTHVRKRQIRRLLDITEQNKETNVETISMVLMALHCIVNDHRNRNLNHYVIHPTKKLGRLQKEDGSFGDVKLSAMAVQALQATDPGGLHWNKTKAINFIRRQQNPNGSFGEEDVIYTTILVILALGPQSLVKVKTMNCQNDSSKDWFNHSSVTTPVSVSKSLDNSSTTASKTLSSTETKTVMSDPEEKLDESATVSYTLWVGSNVTETHNINITTDNNNTFFNVMQLAAQKDDHFSFLSTEWPNGHYVHTLAGYKEEPMSYHYWLLYKLPMPPDPASPPPNQYVAPVGVDELLIEDGDHFLFWYKKL